MRKNIKKLSSDIEKLLFKEIEARLLRLGITRNEFLEEAKIKHLNQEEKIKREKIVAFINRLRYISPDHSIRFNQFLRESVFVWINRLIGIKCMELRGLILDKNDEITEIITTRPEYGNLSKWLRDFRVEEPEIARDRDGGLVASLKKALNKLNNELGFVFEPEYVPGLILPRYNILQDVINLINNSLDYETYKKDDFLGWVYQYFDEEGKQAIFERLNISASNKLEDYDIIPYSQLYTDHYIVEFITQNALGNWWRVHHPDSEALKKWGYLLPQSEEMNDFEKMEIKDIKILDPACGSGHFLLYAFNLLYELYLEEGKIPQNEIPRIILENNLYGVDIDRRAVQLASLSLFLKAKEINPSLTISKLNLYSTDIIFQNKELFEDLKKRMKMRIEEEKELVESIWQGMRKISALGSLLPIEREIEHFIQSRSTGITQFIDGYDTKWEQWKDVLLDTFNEIINNALEKQNSNELLFARDGMRGINFLEVFRNRYDIILMNPPYINSRRMNKNYKEALKNYYGNNYYDTSACFIQRALELLKKGGYLGIVIPHALTFLKNFQTFRNMIIERSKINCFVKLGMYAFSELGRARFRTSIFLAKKEAKGTTIYIDAKESKELWNDLLPIIKSYEHRVTDIKSFIKIEQNPFLFDLPKAILELFDKFSPLNPSDKDKRSIAVPKVGLQTGNNERFIRYKWEIDPNKIGSKWFPINKGGGKIRWFGFQKTYVNWENDGEEIQAYPGSRPQNRKFYFKEGISYSFIGYYFCGRYLPPGYIFEVGGSCIFGNQNLFYLLAYLNSSLGEYILSQLNPSINTQVGDLNRLPIYIPKKDEEKIIITITKKCIKIQKWTYQFVLTDREFKHTGISYSIKKHSNSSLQNVLKLFFNELEEIHIQKLIYEIYLDNKILELYEITSETQKDIINQIDPRVGRFPLIKDYIEHSNLFEKEIKDFIKTLDNVALTDNELQQLIEAIQSGKTFEDLSPYEEISLKFRINPISIAKIRKENIIIPDNFAKNSVEDFLTEIILKLLEIDDDGIIPLSKSTGANHIELRILQELESLVGEEHIESFKNEMQEILGKTLEKWLEIDFFKHHIIQFEKRPPIWHISSPSKNFRCYLYYLKLTEDTASKIRFNYLRPEIDYNNKLLTKFQDILISKGEKTDIKTKRSIKKFEKIMDDLNQFDNQLEDLIKRNFKPNIDNGIKENLRPWQELRLLAINKVIKY